MQAARAASPSAICARIAASASGGDVPSAKEFEMRTSLYVLSLLFVVIAGCGGLADPASEAELAASSQALSCPTICGDNTHCLLPGGSCTEACNACLCKARGGKVVTACVADVDDPVEPAASSAASDSDGAGDGDGFIGETCGSRVCGKGFFCCNASCSACAPVGGGCTQQACFTAD
jgi:hypothetical protein